MTTDAHNKIIAGLQEALAHIRSDCQHEWQSFDRWRDNRLAGRECKKCGVREHTLKSQ